MRVIGKALIWAGAAVGGAVVFAMLGGVPLPVMPWIIAVGLVKLSLVGAAGLMTAGAVCSRLALRQEQRALLPPLSTSGERESGSE